MSNFFLDSVTSEPLESLNDTNDLTRMAYQNKRNDIPLRKNTITDQFENNTFINHKESFEQNNSRLNSLHDEIRILKGKLKVVYEKDETIQSQKCELQKLNSELENLNSFKDKNRILHEDNKSLRNEVERLKIQKLDHTTLINENIRLKKKIIELTNKESKDEIIINECCDSTTIKIDIHTLKTILYTRLKTYHEKHIDNLINQYDLENKDEIDKTTMEKILLEAIHLK